MFNTLKPCLKLFEFMFEIINLEHPVTVNTNIYRKNISEQNDLSDEDSSDVFDVSDDEYVSDDDEYVSDDSDDEIQSQLEKLDISNDIYIIKPSRKNKKSIKKIRLIDIDLLLVHMSSQIEILGNIKAPNLVHDRWLGLK